MTLNTVPCEQRFLSYMAFIVYEVVRVACLSRSWFVAGYVCSFTRGHFVFRFQCFGFISLHMNPHTVRGVILTPKPQELASKDVYVKAMVNEQKSVEFGSFVVWHLTPARSMAL